VGDPLRTFVDHAITDGRAPLLSRIQRGIEKESLRIATDGTLSQHRHPASLGSPLTHPYITTDYSEALLEFVTPVYEDIDETLDFLTRIHRHVYHSIGEEKLWVNSMPCILHGEQSIPIAQYGKSNVGLMKYVYRQGLSARYGRMMQTIAGIHYNFSLPNQFWELTFADPPDRGGNLQDQKSAAYFAGVRNFHRYCWLLIYLFGASPAVCRTFLQGREHNLQELSDSTYFSPAATSIRMSDLGYSNAAQAHINVSHDNLDDYIKTLIHATDTSFSEYERVGIKDDMGRYLQLNTNLLQIENEYYAVIRPKRVAQSGEKPSHALRECGVEYLEVRCIDLDPFNAVGINAVQVRFLDIFLLFCLFDDSPPATKAEAEIIADNQQAAVFYGRDSNTQLIRGTKPIGLQHWGKIICERMQPIAELLDRLHHSSDYTNALDEQSAKLDEPELTPSARIVTELKNSNESFYEFAMRKSTEHEQHFKDLKHNSAADQQFVKWAQMSLDDQKRIEAADDMDFDEFLNRYFTQQ